VTGKKPGTLAVHAGQRPDPSTGAIVAPLVLSSTFAQEGPKQNKGYEYSRSANPTREVLESCIATLEGGKHGIAFASGLAAVTAALHLLRAGEEVLCSADVYLGSLRLFSRVFDSLGINVAFTDFSDPKAVEESIGETVKLVWLETPSNPTLRVYDIAAISTAAKHRGARVVVDNTMATPLLQRPLELGADVVCHSVSKFLNGHADVTAGCLVTSDEELHERLRFLQNALGGVPSPFDCFLAVRGIKTLHLRLERSCENAAILARWLERHPRVARVLYPGLESHPDHALARRQMKLGGGVITFHVKPGPAGDATETARRLLSSTQLIHCADSFGGVESSLEHPLLMSHDQVPEEFLPAMGIEGSLVRLAVGIEHVEDLQADLEQALATAGG
jgi:cystathionine gamma-lyase